MDAPFGPAVAACLLAGIVGCLWLPVLPPWPMLALMFAVGFGLWVGREHKLRLLGIVALGFGLAGLHAAATLAQQLPVALEGEEVEIVGRVADLPQPEPRRTRFEFRVESAEVPQLVGRRLQLAWYDDYGADQPGPRTALGAGQRWRMTVKLRAPRGLRNPGGFDIERHALSKRIAARGYVRNPDAAERLQAGSGIDAWRQAMSARIETAVVAPSSRFVRALALGDTAGLSDPDWETLRANGLTHLIAISGFHVGLAAGFFALLAQGLWWLWPSLSRRWPRVQAAGVAAVLGALVYSAVAGFALPTVRTLLMIAVVVAARLCRRHQRGFDALALAAMAMLLVDPLSALAPGFWLSFAGVAWLLWCLPRGVSSRLQEFVGAQGVATVGLLPLTAVLFGQASLAGPFANLVAVPWWSLVVVPLALLGTAAETVQAGMGGWFWNLSAQAFDLGWPGFERFAASPFALYWLVEGRWFALPMALFGAFWLLLPRAVPGKSLALLLWLPLLWPDRQLPEPGEVELTMLDVGQGLAVVVRTAGHSLLYDTGPAAPEGWDAGERVAVPALRALGIRRLDSLVLSHADNDHAGGRGAVLRAFPASQVWGAPGDPLPETSDCANGGRWEWDGVRFDFLHPGAYFPYLKNESSCVLRIESAHGSALLTGDIGEVVERMMLADVPDRLRADVVTVPHHGSSGSSDAGFVTAVAARLALVSSGHGNRYRHPDSDVVERWASTGSQVAVTAESGALRALIGARGVQLDARRTRLPRLWDAVRRRAASAGLSYRPE